MLLTKNRPVLRKNASPVDMLIDLLIPSRFYRFMQNGREGHLLLTKSVTAWDSAILVGGATHTLK